MREEAAWECGFGQGGTRDRQLVKKSPTTSGCSTGTGLEDAWDAPTLLRDDLRDVGFTTPKHDVLTISTLQVRVLSLPAKKSITGAPPAIRSFCHDLPPAHDVRTSPQFLQVHASGLGCGLHASSLVVLLFRDASLLESIELHPPHP